jgi:hypothetical protein
VISKLSGRDQIVTKYIILVSLAPLPPKNPAVSYPPVVRIFNIPHRLILA